MYEKIKEAVLAHRDMILSAERHIWKNPETGYREWETSKYMAEIFESFGYELTYAGDIPGFYTDIDTGKPGPKLLILGELDSLICSSHPESDKETGAVHCCGHHAQCAALLGIAAALKTSDVLKDLSGSIRLCAVPAEEPIEFEYRKELKDKGIIKYFSGKAEFISRGYFDGMDLAFMIHTSPNPNYFAIKKGSLGIVAKAMTYKGKAAHAGGSPHLGINALYAATQGLSAVNALRETFKEADLVRVHPIISKGGEAVNAIPDDVKVDSFVRAVDFSAMNETNKKVTRALAGAAASMGAELKVFDIVSSAPLRNDETLSDFYEELAREMYPDANFVRFDTIGTGSTDMGDVSLIMPAIHPYIGGAKGTSHGANYIVENPDEACVRSAIVQIVLLHKLLSNDAENAKTVLKNKGDYIMTKDEYLKTLESFSKEYDAVSYSDDSSVTIKY